MIITNKTNITSLLDTLEYIHEMITVDSRYDARKLDCITVMGNSQLIKEIISNCDMDKIKELYPSFTRPVLVGMLDQIYFVKYKDMHYYLHGIKDWYFNSGLAIFPEYSNEKAKEDLK